MTKLYTLGHSSHPLEKFLGLLAGHAIQVLVDVRSHPYSRFHPQYNQKALAAALSDQGLAYLFLGQALGGRPKDPLCYRPKDPLCYRPEDPGEVDYRLVMQRAWFQQGIQDLLAAARQSRTTILCSEADPVRCHRHHLVARYLLQAHPEVEVLHILASGQTLDARTLVDESGTQLGLFSA